MEKEDIVYPIDTIHNSEFIKGEKNMVWINIALFCKAFKSAHTETIIHSHHIHTGGGELHV